jgi:hypothetical protein
MKTLKNKKNGFKKTISYLFFFTLLIFGSCNKEGASADCGCNSEIITTISNQLTGKLFYKNNSNNDNYKNRKYWIIYKEQNFFHNMIICNEDFLSKIDNIPILDNVPDIPYSINQLENAMDVSFTGQLKTICDPIFHPASLTYENITLTKIEQQ